MPWALAFLAVLAMTAWRISTVGRRPHGTRSLFVRVDSRGREAWYGQWRAGGRLVKRRIGPKRRPNTSAGLTKGAAERELRRLIESVTVPVEVMDVAEAGRRWLEHLEAIGRRRSTLMDYESAVRVHLVPFFGARPIARITPDDVERFMALKRREGRSPKSIRNWLGVLHSLLTYAERRPAAGLLTSPPQRRAVTIAAGWRCLRVPLHARAVAPEARSGARPPADPG
ncbi:MAG: site-specific integrase [Thermoleophilaceae bacterium]